MDQFATQHTRSTASVRVAYQHLLPFAVHSSPSLPLGFVKWCCNDQAYDRLWCAPFEENLGGFASHAFQQDGRRQGRNWSDATPWRPVWELAPLAALIPFKDGPVPQLRVYVYGEGDADGVGKLTRSPAFCHYRQWGMDVGFHDFFRTSPIRTFDPEMADFFFVPSYACCHQVAGIADFDELDTEHKALVSQLAISSAAEGEITFSPFTTSTCFLRGGSTYRTA